MHIPVIAGNNIYIKDAETLMLYKIDKIKYTFQVFSSFNLLKPLPWFPYSKGRVEIADILRSLNYTPPL